MYKNNKILKAAAGAPLVLGGIPAAAAAPELIASAGPLALFGGLTALGIYAATHPHASQTYMQDLQAQMAEEELANFELYKSKLAKHYQEKLANGEYVTPSGTHVTSYNPNTMELSGYRIGDNGNIGYITKNVFTKEYGPSVYYDAKTGAYYEGVNTPYGNTVEISRGENLMPWSIIPTTTTVGLTLDNTIMAAPLEVLWKKNKLKPEQPVDSAKSSDVAEAGAQNPVPDPEKKDDNKDKNPESNNPDPKNQKNNWWKQRGQSFKDSFSRPAKAMRSGFTKGSDATMKVVGYSLPPTMVIGTAAGLGYGAYKLGEHFGLWGDENQSKPTSQQSSGDENISTYGDTINYFRNIQWKTSK